MREEGLGLITAITEITRNADKAANALKTIGQRLRGVGDDGEEISGLSAKLQESFDAVGIGIEILNQETGEMASTYDILHAIGSEWGNLTEAQQQYIGELAAGKNRITEFKIRLRSEQSVRKYTFNCWKILKLYKPQRSVA